jgi:hypothetical protein
MVKVAARRRNSSGDCSKAPQSTARVQTDVLASPCPPGVATRRATLGGWPGEDLMAPGQRSTGASANCDRNVACVAGAIVIGPLQLQFRVTGPRSHSKTRWGGPPARSAASETQAHGRDRGSARRAPRGGPAARPPARRRTRPAGADRARHEPEWRCPLESWCRGTCRGCWRPQQREHDRRVALAEDEEPRPRPPSPDPLTEPHHVGNGRPTAQGDGVGSCSKLALGTRWWTAVA